MVATVPVSRIGSGIAAAADRVRRGGPVRRAIEEKPGEGGRDRIGSRHEIGVVTGTATGHLARRAKQFLTSEARAQ